MFLNKMVMLCVLSLINDSLRFSKCKVRRLLINGVHTLAHRLFDIDGLTGANQTDRSPRRKISTRGIRHKLFSILTGKTLR